MSTQSSWAIFQHLPDTESKGGCGPAPPEWVQIRVIIVGTGHRVCRSAQRASAVTHMIQLCGYARLCDAVRPPRAADRDSR